MRNVILIVSLLSLQGLTQFKISERTTVQHSDWLKTVALNPIQSSAAKKSVGLAILYSALLPGMGEYYAGDYSLGKYLTIVEGVGWVTYLGMDYYSRWQKENYKEFAKVNGSVSSADLNDDYYATIGSYMNVGNYNDDMSFQRRFSEMFTDNKYFWSWNSQADRKTYRGMWTSSQQANNNLRFVIGALVLNRVVSVINAVRLVNAHNRNTANRVSYQLSVSPLVGETPGLRADLLVSF
jgi:hypothetical protein